MKKSSASGFSPVLELPHITKTLPRRTSNRTTYQKADPLPNMIPPPTEEMVSYLNRIGREYPFCVYYKQKVNDPL
jgi:hypothetical protein